MGIVHELWCPGYNDRQLRQIYELKFVKFGGVWVPAYVYSNSLKCSHQCQQHWLLTLVDWKSRNSVRIRLLSRLHSSFTSLLVLWSYQLRGNLKCYFKWNRQAANRTWWLPCCYWNVPAKLNEELNQVHLASRPPFRHHPVSSGKRVRLTDLFIAYDYCWAQNIRKWNHATAWYKQIRLRGNFFHSGFPLHASKHHLSIYCFSACSLLPIQNSDQFRDEQFYFARSRTINMYDWPLSWFVHSCYVKHHSNLKRSIKNTWR